VIPDALALALYFAVPASAVVYAAAIQAQRQRRMSSVLGARKPAFAGALSIAALRADPEAQRARLRGKIASVHAGSIAVFSDGPESAGIVGTVYTSFVVDTHGEAHDLEQSHDGERVGENARWVADLLGVPFTAQGTGLDPAPAHARPDAGADAFERAHHRRAFVWGAALIALGSAAWLSAAWAAYVGHEPEFLARAGLFIGFILLIGGVGLVRR
jgi:hypothetical protein